MMDLQLPALIVAIPAGVAIAARGALWVRQVMTPITGQNTTGEWRGRMLTVCEHQERLVREVLQGQSLARQMIRDNTQMLQENSRLIRETTAVLMEHQKREMEVWESVLKSLAR